MLRKYFYLVLLIVAISVQQSGCANLSQELGQGVIGASEKEVIVNTRVERIEEASSNNDDMWNMVASMRDTGGGSSKWASTIKSYSNRNIELDWSINLDAMGFYQLSWQANVSSNQVVFALDINTNKSNFHIGTDIFALGFSDRGQLNSSDFCLIWYDLSHRLHLQDAITNPDNSLQLVDSAESACRLLNTGYTEQIGHRNANDEEFSGNMRARVGTESKQMLDGSAESANISKRNLEIIFSRPLEVCRPDSSYYLIDSGTTHLVWFALKGPLLALDGLNLSEALQRDLSLGAGGDSRGTSNRASEYSGMRRVQLVATKPSSSNSLPNELASDAHSQPSPSSSSKSLDILMEKYEIPAKETTYLCKLVKLPSKFQLRRYHITSYEAVIEPGNEHVVHHMELFNCVNMSPDNQSDLDKLYASGGWSGECSSADRPQSTESCKRVILAWAMGAKPLIYPEQVGQSIGGPTYSAYVMLEVHYNNVAQSGGLIDSSGLRFHYSSHLRPFDAGVLEVGLEYTDKNSVPPGMVTPLAGYCVSGCTRAAMSAPSGNLEEADYSHRDEQDDHDQQQHHHHRARRNRRSGRHRNGRHRGSTRLDEDDSDGGDKLNSGTAKQQQRVGQTLEEGIYVFAAQMHTHLTGVASWTEHVREGRLIGELQRDNHYSPHFQEIRLLPKPVHIAPGDALIHYCLYDTRQRVNVTLGGYATTDEMCVTYLHYYPKIDLEVCKSSVETAALSNYFAYLAHDEGQPTGPLLVEDNVRYDNADDDDDQASTTAAPAPASRGLLQQGKHSRPAVKAVSDNYRSIEWSRRRSRELIEFYNNAPLSVQCNRSDGRRWPGHWNGIMPTQIIELDQLKGGEKEATEGDVDVKLDTVDSGDEPHLAGISTGRKSARQLVEYRGLGANRGLTTHCKRQLARYSDYDFL